MLKYRKNIGKPCKCCIRWNGIYKGFNTVKERSCSLQKKNKQCHLCQYWFCSAIKCSGIISAFFFSFFSLWFSCILLSFLLIFHLSCTLALDQDPVHTAGRGTILPEITRAIVGITVVFVATGGPFSTGAEGVATSHEVTIIEVAATMVTVPTTGTAIETTSSSSSSSTTTRTALGGGARVPTRHGNDQQAEAAHAIPIDHPLCIPGIPALPPVPHPHVDATLALDDYILKITKKRVHQVKAREPARNHPSLQEAPQRNPVASG